MITITLNSLYSWAALLAASDAVKKDKRRYGAKNPTQKRPDSYIVGYRAENALRQHLGYPPIDTCRFNRDIVINGRAYEIKTLQRNGFFCFEPHQIDHSGFIILQQLGAQTFRLYGYISIQRAMRAAELCDRSDVRLLQVASDYLTQW